MININFDKGIIVYKPTKKINNIYKDVDFNNFRDKFKDYLVSNDFKCAYINNEVVAVSFALKDNIDNKVLLQSLKSSKI